MKSTADQVLDELRKAISALDAGLGEASAKAGKHLGASMQDAHSQLQALRGQLQGLSRRFGQAAKATDTSVREHPWEAVAAAAALGLLAGIVLARRGATDGAPDHSSKEADEVWPV